MIIINRVLLIDNIERLPLYFQLNFSFIVSHQKSVDMISSFFSRFVVAVGVEPGHSQSVALVVDGQVSWRFSPWGNRFVSRGKNFFVACQEEDHLSFFVLYWNDVEEAGERSSCRTKNKKCFRFDSTFQISTIWSTDDLQIIGFFNRTWLLSFIQPFFASISNSKL